MTLLGVVKKSAACLRDFGVDETFSRILRKLRLVSESHSLDFFLKELNGRVGDSLPPLPSLKFREILDRELEHVCWDKEMPSFEDLRKQFDRGSRLFAVLDSDRVIAINWMNSKFADLSHIRKPYVPLAQGVAYMYGLFVSSPYRKQRVARWLKNSLISNLRQEGFRFIFLTSYLREAWISRWHVTYGGCKKWGRVTYFLWRGKEFWWSRLTKEGKEYSHLLKEFGNAE